MLMCGVFIFLTFSREETLRLSGSEGNFETYRTSQTFRWRGRRSAETGGTSTSTQALIATCFYPAALVSVSLVDFFFLALLSCVDFGLLFRLLKAKCHFPLFHYLASSLALSL